MGDRRGRGAGVADLLRAGDDDVRGRRLGSTAQSVDEIYTDLTARRGSAGVDLTGVRRLLGERGRGVHR